jgi:starvation-inducible DNA-binding protein
MNLNLGIDDKDRAGAVKILNLLLADEYVLYTKTRNYHWNVVGPQFNDLHKFFGEQYEALDDFVDDVAERARTLGGHSVATLGEFAEAARLKEHPGQFPSDEDMLENLLADHEAIIRQLHADAAASTFHDMGTNDFLTGLMEDHEKMAWMLRSFLEGKSSGRSREREARAKSPFERRLCRRNRTEGWTERTGGGGPSGGTALAPPDLNQ